MLDSQSKENRQIRVLHLEDDPRDAELIQRKLKASGLRCEIVGVVDRKSFETALGREAFDIALLDYNLPDYDGLTALRRVRELRPDLPVIVISGTVGEDEAVECLKAGATDYVLKQRPQRLGAAVSRALKEAEQRGQLRQAEEALRDSEERFRSAMHFSAIGMALVAPDGRWLEVNQALCRITGYSAEELRATDFQSITHPDDLATDLEQVRRMLAREIESYQLEKRYIRKDGGIVWISLGVSLLWTPDGQPRHFIAQIQDITVRKQQEERITRLSRMHALLSGINSLIVRTRDRQELFEEACRLAVEQGGFAFAWIGLSMPGASKVTPAAWAGSGNEYLAQVGKALNDVSEDPGIGGQISRKNRVIVTNDIERDPDVVFKEQAMASGFRSLALLPLLIGERAVGFFALYARATGFFDAEEIRLLGELAGDISFALEHLDKEAQLNYLAYYDELTGLSNRAMLLDRCNRLLRATEDTGSSVAVVLADLERFRHVNETLGRHAGDALLKALAARLKARLPGMADIARVGAGNFAFLQEMRGDIDAARMFEEQIYPAIAAPHEFEGNEYRLSVKAGIALGPRDGKDAETLLQNAESALARAKRSGERRLFYEPQMNAQVGEWLALEGKLRVAVEKEQFVLHYQPKFDTRSKTMTGLEALIRWADPETGLVPPAKFIPLLEQTGMILDVGRWALTKAVADYRRWANDGLSPPPVAVNVSAIQLRQRDFAETVRKALGGRAEPDGCGLDLEITESLAMEDIERNIDKLAAVQGMGLRIHIDDFGTGYSSLSYIARLPINALKIDRAFVNNMLANPHDRTIVSVIILLAHSLNLSVIAEGVETKEQLELLATLNCDQVQGYLFSRPLPAEQVAELLSAPGRFSTRGA